MTSNTSLSAQARKRLCAGELILDGFDNDEIAEILKCSTSAVAAGYPHERWTSKIVADLIQKTFGITLAPRSVRRLLRNLGLSPQMPIVQSRKRDKNAIERWKNETIHEIKKK